MKALKNIHTSDLIIELIQRGEDAKNRNFEFLINKWNSFYLNGYEYGVKIEKRG